MAQTKYYKGLDELHNTDSFLDKANNEFPKEVSVDEFLSSPNLNKANTSRRDFLKYLGFSVTAATVAACETPVIKSIPYVNKPEDITPGIANYYASTYYDGNDYANILVKTREGRPIFIKGNPHHGITGGTVSARINSSVLGLYDSARLHQPVVKGNAATWGDLDSGVARDLANVAGSGQVVVLSSTVISPSTKIVIDDFLTKAGAGAGKHVIHDAISYSATREANQKSFGKAIIPSYDFSKAMTIVSIGADFLSNWPLSTVYTSQYVKNRKPDGAMSRHFQFESNMTVTGSNADVRVPIKASEEGLIALAIYNFIAGKTGVSASNAVSQEISLKARKAAEELLANKGKSLVVAGSNNVNVQLIVNSINEALGNYGSTIDTKKAVNLFQGNDAAMELLVKDMQAGLVKAIFFYNSNPAYNFYKNDEFRNALSKVPLKVSLSAYADETASLCDYIAPDSHYLESWNDFSPRQGDYSLAQPTISPLFKTRQAQDSFLRWSGDSSSFVDTIKTKSLGGVMAGSAGGGILADFWNSTLQNGSVSYAGTVTEPAVIEGATSTGVGVDVNSAAQNVLNNSKASTGKFEVVFYQKVGMGNGNQANNPWLQEFPDPITKVTWDNYITMAPADAREFGFNIYIGQDDPASLATVKVNGKEITLPVFATPGQKSGTVGIALGYGRGENGENIGKAAFHTGEYGGHLEEDGKLITVGKNAYRYLSLVNGNISYTAFNAEISSAGGVYPLASTQTHHTIMGRTSIIRETTHDIYKSSDKDVYNPEHTLAYHEGTEIVQKNIKEIDLWAPHPVEKVGHRWGMSIDLNTCLGCGSCITACHSENNVPVVGKDEVRRSRDMHWLRIDRYFSSAEDKRKLSGEDFSYSEMEIPDENPTVVHMPMMCQHCNHAPCETVCPVAATTHSNEGLNQMTYNRCIGTRYCANNCPYKVRRFNWFNYQEYRKFTEVNPAQDDLGRMVLNPDVTVRARGVMEKCSLCVQRIQLGKLDAKKAGKPIADGEVVTACSEACPSGAITFGDLNDTSSKVTANAASKRAYRVIEEVGTQPNIYYMVKVRNIEEKEA